MADREPKKTILCWSSGKDSAWALHALRGDPAYDVVGLMTTLNAAYDRVAMHGVRRELLELQALAAGLPLEVLEIPDRCTNEEYERVMAGFTARASAAGVEMIAFGDLFLEDIRSYRESKLAGSGLAPLFPLWGRPTPELARAMIAGGLRARITCVDASQLDPRFAGREFDAALLADLPAGVDPCGERGEFHSFVYDGPMFRHPIAITGGDVVDREGFTFADLLVG